MIRKSHKIRRLVTVIALTLSTTASAAQPALAFDGRSPDTRDAVRQASAGDATLVDARSPDTRDAAGRIGSTPLVDGRSPDARDAAFRSPVVSPDVVSADRFNWGDFGVGVGVAVTSMLLIAGIAGLALAARQRAGERTGPATT